MTALAFLTVLAAAILGYVVNLRAAEAIRTGGTRMHSLSVYHGYYAALTTLVPVFVLILLWLALEGPVVDRLIMASLPDSEMAGLETGATQLVMAEIKSIAGGRVFGTPAEWKLEAAERLKGYTRWASALLLLVVAGLSGALLWLSRRRVAAGFRARQGTERIVS